MNNLKSLILGGCLIIILTSVINEFSLISSIESCFSNWIDKFPYLKIGKLFLNKLEFQNYFFLYEKTL